MKLENGEHPVTYEDIGVIICLLLILGLFILSFIQIHSWLTKPDDSFSSIIETSSWTECTNYAFLVKNNLVSNYNKNDIVFGSIGKCDVVAHDSDFPIIDIENTKVDYKDLYVTLSADISKDGKIHNLYLENNEINNIPQNIKAWNNVDGKYYVLGFQVDTSEINSNIFNY